MKIALLIALMALMICSEACHAKKKPVSVPGEKHYFGCHEVSVDYGTKLVTIVCPLQ